MIEIKWSNNLITDKKNVELLEEKWGITFPTEYVEIVLKHNAAIAYVKNKDGVWRGGVVQVPGKEKEGVAFLSFLEKDFRGRVVARIELSYDALREVLPPKIIPFAENGGGDKFLFDYRNNPYEPKIVFLIHDDLIPAYELTQEDLLVKSLEEWQCEKLYPVCNSFSEFLEMIEPRDE